MELHLVPHNNSELILAQALSVPQATAGLRDGSKSNAIGRPRLLSVPCVLLGAFFTAPNLNLINGMPSYLAIVGGLVLMR